MSRKKNYAKRAKNPKNTRAFDKIFSIIYNQTMQKSDIQNKQKISEKLLPLPFFIIMFVAVLLFLGGLLFLLYSIVLVTATKSPMIFLIVFAASLICFGLGILSLHGFFAYGKRYKNRKNGTAVSPSKNAQSEKTFKDYITLQNVSLVVLLVGAILAIVSAALGAMNREKWLQATSPYLESHNYYSDVKYREYRYSADTSDGTNKLVVDFTNKNAVVIYTDDSQKQGFITIDGYEKYVNEIALTKSERTLFIQEGEKPNLDGALEKLLFFMFNENEIESQIKIYIPTSQKDTISLEGDFVIAQ